MIEANKQWNIQPEQRPRQMLPVPSLIPEPVQLAERTASESEAWLLSVVIPMLPQILDNASRFTPGQIEEKNGEYVAHFEYVGSASSAQHVANVINLLTRFAAYNLSAQGGEDFHIQFPYEDSIELPRKNRRISVEGRVRDVLRRNKDILLGEARLSSDEI